MKCPISGKPCVKHKAFHVTEKKDGKTTDHSVCEDCLYSPAATKIQIPEYLGECPDCGTTLKHIVEGGKMGCAKCYESFGLVSEGIIASIQGVKECLHKGNVPETWKRQEADKVDSDKFMEAMRRRMERAVQDEDYETASIIKSKLSEFSVMLEEYNSCEREQAPSLLKGLADFIYVHGLPGH